MFTKKIILSCEHGGAQIPKAYKDLFQGQAAVLKTHRALDLGALAIAKEMQKNLQVPLDFSVVTRLLVDLNRFLDSPTLFSEFTKTLTQKEKQKIIRRYYRPHWNKITRRIKNLNSKKHQVFHIAVHSMTDQWNGKTRPMQIALLYDSKIKVEKDFARIWTQELKKEFPNYKIAHNRPYRGDGEGLTSFFRKNLGEKKYLGIELEMNQAMLKKMNTQSKRKKLSQALAISLERALNRV